MSEESHSEYSLVEAEPLRELWFSNFKVQIETKSGEISFVQTNDRNQHRPTKRRRIDTPEVEMGRGDIGEANQMQMDYDYGFGFDGMDWGGEK